MNVIDTGHLARLQRALEVDEPVSLGLVQAGQDLVDEARFNLNDGAISGPGHIPGPPGGYSKSDTHELEQSLAVQEPIANDTTIYVAAGSFGVAHAVYQELGTETIVPRPNLQLATSATRHQAVKHIAANMRAERNGT